jgi:hypothetical protein
MIMKASIQNSVQNICRWLPICAVIFFSSLAYSASYCFSDGEKVEPKGAVWNIQQLLDYETEDGVVYHGTSIENAIKLLTLGTVGPVWSGEVALFVSADYYQATHHARRKGGIYSAIIPIKIKKVSIKALNELTEKGTYSDRFKYDVIITPDKGRPGSPFRDLYIGNSRILELPSLGLVLKDMAQRLASWNQMDSPVFPTEFWKQYKNLFYAVPAESRAGAPIPELIKPNDPNYIELID